MAHEATAHDRELSALRRRVAHKTADWLADFGLMLWQANWLDDAVSGLATVTQMVGQIGQEASDAYEKERYYAGSCLTRQLVEAHYLLAYFASDSSQPGRWLGATKNRLEKSFKPAKLRELGGFDGHDYQVHCSWGGHPTPQAKWLLPDHQPLASPELHWVDLQQHMTDSVLCSIRAAGKLNEDDSLTDALGDRFEMPPETLFEWMESDPLAKKLKLADAATVVGPYLLNSQVPPPPPLSAYDSLNG